MIPGAQAAWRGLRILRAALNRYLDADGMRQGAAVSFYAAFSMAPLLVVVAAVMVWLLGDESARTALIDTLTRLIGARETRTLSDLLASHPSAETEGTQALFGTALALATTLIGATGVFVELRAAIQSMLGEKDGAFSWWRLLQVRLLAMGVVLGSGFLLSIAMVAQAGLWVALKWLAAEWSWLSPVLLAAESLWSWGIVTLLFAMMIRWLPNARLPVRHALLGGAAAATLFMVGRYGISVYVANTALQSALGAASSFAALLVWVYWSSQMFLLGAALAVEMGQPATPSAHAQGADHADPATRATAPAP